MAFFCHTVLTAAALGAAPLRLRGGAHPRDNNLELPQRRLRGGGSSHPLDSPSALPRLRQLQETLSGAESSSLRHLDPAELASLASELRGAISAPDAEGLTRLHRAVMEQDNRRVQRLLAASADVEAAAGPLGVRPLHLAVLAGDERTGVLEQLIKAGADPAARDARGTGAIHAAVALNLPHVTDLLLGAGVGPEGKGAKGALPIQLAAWANAAEAIEALALVSHAPPGCLKVPPLTLEKLLHQAATRALDVSAPRAVLDRFPQAPLIARRGRPPVGPRVGPERAPVGGVDAGVRGARVPGRARRRGRAGGARGGAASAVSVRTRDFTRPEAVFTQSVGARRARAGARGARRRRRQAGRDGCLRRRPRGGSRLGRSLRC